SGGLGWSRRGALGVLCPRFCLGCLLTCGPSIRWPGERKKEKARPAHLALRSDLRLRRVRSHLFQCRGTLGLLTHAGRGQDALERSAMGGGFPFRWPVPLPRSRTRGFTAPSDLLGRVLVIVGRGCAYAR